MRESHSWLAGSNKNGYPQHLQWRDVLCVCRGDDDDGGDVMTSHPERARGYNNSCYVWNGTYQSAINQLTSYRKNDYTQIPDPSLHILSDVLFRITQYISLGQLVDGLLVREINMERQRWLITGVLKRFIWEATSRRWPLPIDMHPSIVGDEE